MKQRGKKGQRKKQIAEEIDTKTVSSTYENDRLPCDNQVSPTEIIHHKKDQHPFNEINNISTPPDNTEEQSKITTEATSSLILADFCKSGTNEANKKNKIRDCVCRIERLSPQQEIMYQISSFSSQVPSPLPPRSSCSRGNGMGSSDQYDHRQLPKKSNCFQDIPFCQESNDQQEIEKVDVIQSTATNTKYKEPNISSNTLKKKYQQSPTNSGLIYLNQDTERQKRTRDTTKNIVNKKTQILSQEQTSDCNSVKNNHKNNIQVSNSNEHNNFQCSKNNPDIRQYLNKKATVETIEENNSKNKSFENIDHSKKNEHLGNLSYGSPKKRLKNQQPSKRMTRENSKSSPQTSGLCERGRKVNSRFGVERSVFKKADMKAVNPEAPCTSEQNIPQNVKKYSEAGNLNPFDIRGRLSKSNNRGTRTNNSNPSPRRNKSEPPTNKPKYGTGRDKCKTVSHNNVYNFVDTDSLPTGTDDVEIETNDVERTSHSHSADAERTNKQPEKHVETTKCHQKQMVTSKDNKTNMKTDWHIGLEPICDKENKYMERSKSNSRRNKDDSIYPEREILKESNRGTDKCMTTLSAKKIPCYNMYKNNSLVEGTVKSKNHNQFGFSDSDEGLNDLDNHSVVQNSQHVMVYMSYSQTGRDPYDFETDSERASVISESFEPKKPTKTKRSHVQKRTVTTNYTRKHVSAKTKQGTVTRITHEKCAKVREKVSYKKRAQKKCVEKSMESKLQSLKHMADESSFHWSQPDNKCIRSNTSRETKVS